MSRTPEQIAGTSEHSQQAAYIAWCNRYAWETDARLKFVFAVPNAGKRGVKVASMMLAEGLKAGVPDIVVPITVGEKPGFWIEFKKPGTEKQKAGGLKPKQVEWRDFLKTQGYHHAVCYDWQQARDATLLYLQKEV